MAAVRCSSAMRRPASVTEYPAACSLSAGRSPNATARAGDDRYLAVSREVGFHCFPLAKKR